MNPNHPDRYVVKRGDTLWDISAMFLRDPWFWPEIWQVNPQVSNPHLIYPGDVLVLVYVDGQPQLRLEQRAGGTNRLSPSIRVEDLDEAIMTIPLSAIGPFLSKGTFCRTTKSISCRTSSACAAATWSRAPATTFTCAAMSAR